MNKIFSEENLDSIVLTGVRTPEIEEFYYKLHTIEETSKKLAVFLQENNPDAVIIIKANKIRVITDEMNCFDEV